MSYPKSKIKLQWTRLSFHNILEIKMCIHLKNKKSIYVIAFHFSSFLYYVIYNDSLKGHFGEIMISNFPLFFILITPKSVKAVLEKKRKMQIGFFIVNIVYESNKGAIFWKWQSLCANAFNFILHQSNYCAPIIGRVELWILRCSLVWHLTFSFHCFNVQTVNIFTSYVLFFKKTESIVSEWLQWLHKGCLAALRPGKSWIVHNKECVF